MCFKCSGHYETVCVAVGKPILIVQLVSAVQSTRTEPLKLDLQYHLMRILENEGSGFLYELKTRDISLCCSNEAFL